jgi:2-keto-4-pentenoate hydratase/2-oxohepta-3-ene-1,7-dioic acid hydratase in catechol pathway
MKWVRVDHNHAVKFGLLEGEQISVYEGDLFGEKRATGERVPVAEVRWLTPCTPSKMLALWNNFSQAAQKNGWTRPEEPLWFLKAPSSFAAHEEPIAAPPGHAGRVAYEGELAIVIGRLTRAVPIEQAASHIFGYTIGNDLTALELLQRDSSFAQWCRAKSFDGFGIFGPAIETDLDVQGARVRTIVDGRVRQDYPLSDMFFSPQELVSRLSQDVTLLPGDVILCGTSLGVLPMRANTRVEVSIDGIGVLVNVFAPKVADEA